MTPRSTKALALALTAVFQLEMLIPAEAAAHLVTTGLGPVYDGIGHFLMTPEDLVPVLALALYSGLRGAGCGRCLLFLLPLAWLAGGAAGYALNVTPPVVVPAVSFLLLGALVAADLRLSRQAAAMTAVAVGLAHGSFNGAVLRDGAGLLGLLGCITAVIILFSVTAAFVVTLKKPWARIAVRVAGSWTFAGGLLMLGWLFRGAS